MELSTDRVVVAEKDNVSSKVADEEVILNLKNGTYYGLDPIGAHIWSLVQEPTSIGALIDRLVDHYEVGREQCMKDVTNLLRDMEENGLVDIQ